MDILDKGCQMWSCQEGEKDEDFVAVVKEDMQKVRMIEDDANDKVRWKWIHYSGQPKKEVCIKVI